LRAGLAAATRTRPIQAAPPKRSERIHAGDALR